MNARLHALLERPAVAWSRTWLLPIVLASVSGLVYLFMILPFDARPWYTRPPPKPGKSVIFRSLNHVHRVHDEVEAKLARRAASAVAPANPAKRGASPTPTPTPSAGADEASADSEGDPGRSGRTRPGGVDAFAEPRPAAELGELWGTLGAAPYGDEPIAGPWAAAHRSLIFQIVALAREKTFKGAPDTPQIALGDVECRTIRCSIALTSPYPHELELLSDALGRIALGGRPLWRTFEPGALVPVEDEEAEDAGSALQRTVILGFREDLPEVQALVLDGKRLSPPTTLLGPSARRDH